MNIYELIDDDIRRQLNAKKPVVHRPKQKNKEKLSRREIEKLMGTKRDRYHKVNGKVKRK